MRFWKSKREYKKQFEAFQIEIEKYTHGKCPMLAFNTERTYGGKKLKKN